jgi:hypothetical protein
MAFTLPLTNQLLPDYRILWRQGFGAGTGAADDKSVSGAGWREIPLQRRGVRQHGFYLKHFERVALPQVGTAAFAYAYGVFDDTTVDAIDIAELRNAEVRIQVSPRGEEAWATAFWGTIDYVEDIGSPGALTPMGEKVYHCVDGLYRAKRWPLDRHGFEASGGANYGVASGGNAYGNPGYNWSQHHDAVSAGNKSASAYLSHAGVSVSYHTPPGAGSKWTDLEAVEHALGASKPAGEPLFTLDGATDLLGGTNPWEVKPGDSVLDFLLRVLRRERGRGLVHVDWDDDSGDPDGPLTVKLTIGAQLAANVSYVTNFTSGATTSLQGATSRGTSTSVDLTGDHRCVDGSLELGNPDQFRVEYLETEGEPIELLATLSYLDGALGTASGSTPSADGVGLTKGWSAADQAEFVALTTTRRQEERYKPVFQLHRFNPAWGGYLGDGNGGTQSRSDYRCTAAGRVVTPLSATAAELADPAVAAATSPLLIEVLPDLPLFEAYKYSGASVARNDAAAEGANPQRRKLFGFVRVASGRFLTFDQTSTGSVHISVDGDAIWIIHSGDEGTGTRYFSTSPSSASLSAVYAYYVIGLTVGLRLPHRVRLASGNPLTAGARGKIYVPGSHLWLASAGAIYDFDQTTASSGGFAVRRGAVGATEAVPGILRDDRAGLAAIHALSWAWFGSDTTHRSASWSLRACGFLPSYEAYAGDSIPSDGTGTQGVTYPTIGYVVTTLTANGADHTLNTPITRVHYDAEKGVTAWSTEWNELEVK